MRLLRDLGYLLFAVSLLPLYFAVGVWLIWDGRRGSRLYVRYLAKKKTAVDHLR